MGRERGGLGGSFLLDWKKCLVRKYMKRKSRM